jgi:hypothetical protein
MMVTKATGQRAKGRNHKPAPHANLPPGAPIMDIKRHGGRCIATRHGKVVAVADSFVALQKEVERLGIANEVTFTEVPRSGAFVY